MTGAETHSEAQPLVSIGLPTYNRPAQLKSALAGIVAQSYRNLEIIVSDNASPGDETDLVVREFMRSDPRIRYHRHPENRGQIFNFQFVLDQARGDYFLWAADDDWRHADYVQALLEQMTAAPDASLAFCDFNELDLDGNRHPGYPDHHDLLVQFTTPTRWLRLWRYFMQYEHLGKANIVYGMIRRKHLEGFDGAKFAAEQGNVSFGMDMLLAYWMLGLGRLALSDRRLYGCTVGNVKDYEAPRRDSLVSHDRNYIVSVMSYSLRYIPLTEGPARLLVALSLPLKIVKNMVMLRHMVWNVVTSPLASLTKRGTNR